jgi:hypothetical protein
MNHQTMSHQKKNYPKMLKCNHRYPQA